jgi:hypothetical protein
MTDAALISTILETRTSADIDRAEGPSWSVASELGAPASLATTRPTGPPSPGP